jgi:hypothetical protein
MFCECLSEEVLAVDHKLLWVFAGCECVCVRDVRWMLVLKAKSNPGCCRGIEPRRIESVWHLFEDSPRTHTHTHIVVLTSKRNTQQQLQVNTHSAQHIYVRVRRICLHVYVYVSVCVCVCVCV